MAWITALLERQDARAAEQRREDQLRFTAELERLAQAQRDRDERHAAELRLRDEMVTSELRRHETDTAALRQHYDATTRHLTQLHTATLDALRQPATPVTPPTVAPANSAPGPPAAPASSAPLSAAAAPSVVTTGAPSASAAPPAATGPSATPTRPRTPPPAARALFAAARQVQPDSPLNDISEFFRRALIPDTDEDSVIPQHVYPAELSAQGRETMLKEALHTGPHAMGVDVPGTLIPTLLRNVHRVQFVPPPAPSLPTSWLEERRSSRPRSSPAASTPVLDPSSLLAFSRSWATWQRHAWSCATYGSRNAVEAGTALATCYNTVHTLHAERPWSEVRAWILFTIGLWMRTHMLIAQEIPDLWPYILRAAAHHRGSAAPAALPRRPRAQPPPTSTAAPSRSRITDDIPPRQRDYTCVDCSTVGWTRICCPVCHPDRPGAREWNDAFATGSHSRDTYRFGFTSQAAMEQHKNRNRSSAAASATSTTANSKPPAPSRG